MVTSKITQFRPKSIHVFFKKLEREIKHVCIRWHFINTFAFCKKYEALLLSCSMALLSNPINKFIRYTAINSENKTINRVRDGFSLYSQLDKAFESPIKRKK